VGVDAVTRAIFLDRDGVINREVFRTGQAQAPFTLADFEILPGVPDALDRLHRAGFLLVLVTNQPDVVRGLASRDQVEVIHDDVDGCACRKPAPGMLYAAAVALDITLGDSYLVGDRWRDVGAGRSAGCTTILVESDRDEPTTIEPHVRVPGLSEAATWILEHAEKA
jgi:D-glycero-D-manno-heptose 1,7-bisphosphate phosphatase